MKNDVLDYLRQVASLRKAPPPGWNYSGFEDLLLRKGMAFKPAALPPSVARGPMKQCFRNAALLAMKEEGLAYVEGYALSIIPVLHAWCVDSLGFVVDPTWPDAASCQYHGIAFKTDYLSRHLARHKCYGILGGDFVAATQLLQSERELEKAMMVLPGLAAPAPRVLGKKKLRRSGLG